MNELIAKYRGMANDAYNETLKYKTNDKYYLYYNGLYQTYCGFISELQKLKG